jgi:hypothetical protein
MLGSTETFQQLPGPHDTEAHNLLHISSTSYNKCKQLSPVSEAYLDWIGESDTSRQQLTIRVLRNTTEDFYL